MTDDKLVPDLEADLEASIAVLIAMADSGNTGAAQELATVVQIYQLHPDVMVRYMSRLCVNDNERSAGR